MIFFLIIVSKTDTFNQNITEIPINDTVHTAHRNDIRPQQREKFTLKEGTDEANHGKEDQIKRKDNKRTYYVSSQSRMKPVFILN